MQLLEHLLIWPLVCRRFHCCGPYLSNVFWNFRCSELLDNGTFTKSVDCYAMGMVIWEIFTKEIPFGRMDVSEIRQKVLSGKRPAIPSYSMHPRVAALINRCW
jgi:hypothetical protein